MANQTCNPQLITQALGIQATGPRTVIVPADPIIWDEDTSYEYLTLVASTDFGQAYISKKDVPAGTPLTNTDYWIPAASYNAQLTQIQKQLADKADQTALDAEVTRAKAAEQAIVQDYDARITAVEEAGKDLADDVHSTLSGSGLVTYDAPVQNLEKIVDVFLSFSKNIAKLTYGAPSIFALNRSDDGVYSPMNLNMPGGKFAISCSTFTLLASMGITYERSRFATGMQQVVSGQQTLVGGTNTSIGGNMFLDMASDFARKYWQSEEDGAFFSSGLAHMLYDTGYYHPCDAFTALDRLAPGDIVFYANADEGSSNWGNINHCDIFLGWFSNSEAIVMTVHDASDLISIYRRPLSSEVWRKTCGYARIPGTCAPKRVNNILVSYDEAVYENPASTPKSVPRINFNTTDYLDYNRLYTIAIKAKIEKGSNFRFTVYGANQSDENNRSMAAQIYPEVQGYYVGDDTYFATFDTYYINTPSTDVNAIRVVLNADSDWKVKIEKIQMFDGFVQPFPI